MLLLVLCCAALLLLAGYVAFVLFVGNSTETGTSLADYISESTSEYMADGGFHTSVCSSLIRSR